MQWVLVWPPWKTAMICVQGHPALGEQHQGITAYFTISCYLDMP